MARTTWHTRRVARVAAGRRRCARCVLTPGTGVPGPVRRRARPSAMPNRDERRIAPRLDRGVPFCLRRPAIELGTTWASVTEPGAVAHLEEGSRWTIPVQVHEPSNRMTASRPGGPSGRQSSSASSLSATTKPSGIGGLRRICEQRSAVGRPQLPALGWRRRWTPRRSRSAWTTRAEAAMSGSRITVPTSQST